MRLQGYWAESLFGEAKDFHRLSRFRLRGLLKVNLEDVMVTAGQKPETTYQVHDGGVLLFSQECVSCF